MISKNHDRTSAALSNDKAMKAVYKIKPLKWVCSRSSECVSYDAQTPLGHLYVKRVKEGWDAANNWQSWRWGYCFDEYYNEDSFECSTLAEGKTEAVKLWIGRVTACLNEVTP
jgi:hypothetical protein